MVEGKAAADTQDSKVMDPHRPNKAMEGLLLKDTDHLLHSKDTEVLHLRDTLRKDIRESLMVCCDTQD